MAKQIIKLAQVRAGDIISFKYKSKKTNRRLMQTILVLNPRLPVILKDSTQKIHTIGLKLEESNRSSLRGGVKKRLFESIGILEEIDKENQLYRVNIKNRYILPGQKGLKESFYTKLKPYVKKYDIYRIYDWEKLRNIPVYLEPITFV